MKWRRRAVQIIIFVLFLFLFLKTTYQGEDILSDPVNIFLRLDPLIALVTMISVRKVISGFLGAFLILAATFMLGRFFCGWVCPLGTILDFISSVFYRKAGAVREPPLQQQKWYRWKYYILIFLLASSFFSLQLIFLFDPISLLTRSLTISIYPAFNYLFSNGRYFPQSVKNTVFLDAQPVFLLNFFIASIFLFIIFLEKIQKRFWCRNLCPLGAMFGLAARFSLFRRVVGPGCNDCGLCRYNCKMNAVRDDVKHNLSFECIDCFTCADACSAQEVNFVFSPKVNSNQKFDLSRRQMLFSVFGGVFAVPVVKNMYPRRNDLLTAMDDYLIRPPGALPETEFLKRCTRCGECMRVCLVNALHPSLMEAGLEGLWSPILVPRLGYCEFNCTLCGQVCPTQAIKELTQQEKKKEIIGLAHFDKNRCLPYARLTNCMVCEEHCPVSPKAIVFDETKDLTREGQPVKLPRVIDEKCIGCGICQNKCPIQGKGAIIVTRVKD